MIQVSRISGKTESIRDSRKEKKRIEDERRQKVEEQERRKRIELKRVEQQDRD